MSDRQVLPNIYTHLYSLDTPESLIVKYEDYNVLYEIMSDVIIACDPVFTKIVLHVNAEDMITKHNMLAGEDMVKCIVHTLRDSAILDIEGLNERILESLINDYGWVRCTELLNYGKYDPRYNSTYLLNLRDFEPMDAYGDVVLYIDQKFGDNLRCEYKNHNSSMIDLSRNHVISHRNNYGKQNTDARLFNGDKLMYTRPVYVSVDDNTMHFIPHTNGLIKITSS
jgi:hypothetical protein